MGWLPIEDAAAALGVSVSTVRRRIRAGELRAERDATPQGFRYRVWVEGTVIPHPEPPAEAEIMALRAERDWLRARVEELTALVNREQETSLRLSQALGQRPAIASPVATQTPTRDEQVATPLHEVEKPPQAPATLPVRRPWWKRLLGG